MIWYILIALAIFVYFAFASRDLKADLPGIIVTSIFWLPGIIVLAFIFGIVVPIGKLFVK